MTNSIGEIEDADTMLVIGANPPEAHPVIGYRIKMAKKKGATLIVADPRRTELAEYADVHLRLRPGTNEALINGMMNVIITEGLADEKFIQERTEGFAAMKAVVDKYTPEHAEKITGVAAEDIRRAARLFAGAERASIFYTLGITNHTTGTDSVLSVANLSLLTGNLGKRSAGVNPLRGQNNVQGACDMGALPNVFTGYQRVDDREARTKFERAWGARLNPQPGLTITDIFNAILAGEIKFLYVFGENPALTEANLHHVWEALEEVEFLVVQDLFLTETAAYADVVLPAAAFAEKQGTFTNTERRVQMVRKAVDPPGEAKADWLILCELARKLGLNWDYASAEDIFQEMARLTPSYAGISHQRLEEEEGLQWPCPTADHPGTLYLHKDKFVRGKGQFTPVEHQPPAEEPDEEYPILLTTGRILYHYNTMTRYADGIESFRPEELAQINPEDAARMGIEEGDLVKMSSRRGHVQVRLTVTDAVPPGVIYMTFHYHESAVNLLTIGALDPVTKTPEFKVCAVRIDKLAEIGA